MSERAYLSPKKNSPYSPTPQQKSSFALDSFGNRDYNNEEDGDDSGLDLQGHLDRLNNPPPTFLQRFIEQRDQQADSQGKSAVLQRQEEDEETLREKPEPVSEDKIQAKLTSPQPSPSLGEGVGISLTTGGLRGVNPLVQREEVEEEEIQTSPQPSPSQGEGEIVSPLTKGGLRGVNPLVQREEVEEKEIQTSPQPSPSQGEGAKVSPLAKGGLRGINPLIQREEVEEEESGEEDKKSLQAKLTIGQPGDKYEQEADNMAAKVMAMPEPKSEVGSRKSEVGEIQPKSLAEDVTSTVQRRTNTVQRKEGGSQGLESQLASEKGGGSPLPEDVRGFMESRFEADFSDVRVHTGITAVQMNKDIGAQAFTHGNDIYYGKGKSPGKNDLTAHELTHTIQQTGGKIQAKAIAKSDSLKTNKIQAKLSIQLREAPPTDKEDEAKPESVPGKVEDKGEVPSQKEEVTPAPQEKDKDTTQTESKSGKVADKGEEGKQVPGEKEGKASESQEKAKPESAPQGKTEGTSETSSVAQGENAAVETEGEKAVTPDAETAKTEGNLESVAVAGEKQSDPSSNGAGGGEKTAASPEDDPGFQAVVAKATGIATEKKQHKPAQGESKQAQDAAESPANEVESQAQDKQVGEMQQQKPGTFSAEGFKSQILSQLKDVMPNNEEEAEKFKESNQVDTVKNSVSSQIADEQKNAASPIEEKTKEAPDTSGIESRQAQPMEPAEEGGTTPAIDGTQAAPKPKGEGEVSAPLQAHSQSLDQKMAEADVTEEQLANSNEPQFVAALDAKKTAKTETQKAPGVYRKQEQGILAQAKTDAQGTVDNETQGMQSQREQMLAQVTGLKDTTKGQDEQKRSEVANHINGIYTKVKGDVENSLNGLDSDVTSKFETAANNAKQVFEDYVDKKMKAYKKKRYGEGLDTLSLGNLGRRIGDAFTGLPPEVNKFFVNGKKKYIKAMNAPLTEISKLVADRLNGAKQKIADGKQEIQTYVKGLPQDLQKVGQEAAQNIQGKFDQLEQSVDAKKDQLVESITQKYKDNLQAVDSRIEEMKAQNKGFWDKAMDFMGGTIKTILEIKSMLAGVLAGATSAITKIIADPIGFLGNLIEGLKQGFTNFTSNIGKHLKGGLIAWLTGTMGGVGIQIPQDVFSLKGIFDLVTQILGLTWNYIRRKATKMFGEPVVAAMEEGSTIFQIIRDKGPAGLWEHVQEQFTDLKASVMEQIQSMLIVQVIQSGIMWILSLLNPASAFVRAAKMIVDIVMFFINRGSQVMSLVQAVVQSIKAIASGSVGGVAKAIESALAKSLPVVIGFLASLAGVGGLANKVKKIVGNIRKRIDKAINKLLLKAKKFFKGKKGKGKNKKSKFTQKDKKAGLAAFEKAEKALSKENTVDKKTAKKVAKQVKRQHPVFKSITVIDGGKSWDYDYVFRKTKKTVAKKPEKGKVNLSELNGWRPKWRTSTDRELAKQKGNQEHYYIKNGKPRLKKKNKVHRRHKVSFEAIVKDIRRKVEGKSYQNAKKILTQIGYVPSRANNKAILSASKKYLRDRFNDPNNVWIGDAKENEKLGRKISQLLRSLRKQQDTLKSIQKQSRELRQKGGSKKSIDELRKQGKKTTHVIKSIVDKLYATRLDAPRGKTVKAAQDFLDILDSERMAELDLISTLEA